jgi:hypothetical protein
VPAIRSTFPLLAAWALVVLLALSGFLLVLAIGSSEPRAGKSVELAPLPVLPVPERLPPRRLAVPAAMQRDGIGTQPAIPAVSAPLTLEVRGLPPDLPAGGGIAVFTAETGGLVHWLPLSAGTPAAGALTFTADVLVDQPLRITVAPSECAAHASYWVQQLVAGPRPGPTTVALRADVQRTTIRWVSAIEGYGQDVQLRRRGEPGWRPIDAAAAWTTDVRLQEMHLWLGPGAYELTPVTAGPWEPATIHVPGPSAVTVVVSRPAAVPGNHP